MRTPPKLSVCVVAVLLSGCATAPAFRAHPNWDTQRESIHTILVVPARIDVFQITAGGVREEINEWSLEAKNNLSSAIVENLQSRPGLSVSILSEEGLPEDLASNLREMRALFDAVNTSVIMHTYGHKTVQFQDKIADFDYSLGEEVGALTTGNADAILVVWGVNHVLSAGNVARQIATGVVLGLLTGAVPVQTGTTYVSFALIDVKSGAVLWFRHLNNQQGGGNYSLHHPESAATIVDFALADFSVGRENEKKPD